MTWFTMSRVINGVPLCILSGGISRSALADGVRHGPRTTYPRSVRSIVTSRASDDCRKQNAIYHRHLRFVRKLVDVLSHTHTHVSSAIGKLCRGFVAWLISKSAVRWPSVRLCYNHDLIWVGLTQNKPENACRFTRHHSCRLTLQKVIDSTSKWSSRMICSNKEFFMLINLG